MQAGARSVSQPPAPGTKPLPVIEDNLPAKAGFRQTCPGLPLLDSGDQFVGLSDNVPRLIDCQPGRGDMGLELIQEDSVTGWQRLGRRSMLDGTASRTAVRPKPDCAQDEFYSPYINLFGDV